MPSLVRTGTFCLCLLSSSAFLGVRSVLFRVLFPSFRCLLSVLSLLSLLSRAPSACYLSGLDRLNRKTDGAEQVNASTRNPDVVSLFHFAGSPKGMSVNTQLSMRL